MKKYTCIIADDEPLARELLAAHVSKIPNLEIVAACSNAIEARFALERHVPDLLFLDIQMPNLTGLELLRMLKKRPVTILTTAFSEHALEGYELDVLDYLLKPIEFERFFKAVSKAIDWLDRLDPNSIRGGQTAQIQPILMEATAPADDYFFVKSDYKMVKIAYADILFVEALQKYIRIHTTSQRVVTLLSMSQIEASLPAEKFARIHRSHLVNLEKIDEIDGSAVRIGKQVLPISKGQREAFLERVRQKLKS